MERATSNLRRGGAVLWSLGTGHQELNLVISELKNLKSHVKTVKDSQTIVLQDMTNWACTDESRPLKELFVNLLDLSAMWNEAQKEFADQISEFRHEFEMILESEKCIDIARNKYKETENAEFRAKKKLKKMRKKNGSGDLVSITNKVSECIRQTEIAQAEVSQKIQENEAVKLIRVKEGLLKLTEAYLALSHKGVYIFEAQRDMTKCLPDVDDREIHEIRYNGLSAAKDILARARDRVKNYGTAPEEPAPSARPRRRPHTLDPPPPYSPSLFQQRPPAFNPYYNQSAGEGTSANAAGANQNANDESSGGTEELAGAMQAASI